jgi:hypothetical protein
MSRLESTTWLLGCALAGLVLGIVTAFFVTDTSFVGCGHPSDLTMWLLLGLPCAGFVGGVWSGRRRMLRPAKQGRR